MSYTKEFYLRCEERGIDPNDENEMTIQIVEEIRHERELAERQAELRKIEPYNTMFRDFMGELVTFPPSDLDEWASWENPNEYREQTIFED